MKSPPVIDAETVIEGFRPMYGLLASIGVVKGKPFTPDARMKKILTEAANTVVEELRTVNHANRIPERIYWQDRRVGRLFVLTTMESDDHCLRVAEDSVHHRVRSIAGKTVGIEEALLSMHSSRYQILSNPKTPNALSILLAFYSFT